MRKLLYRMHAFLFMRGITGSLIVIRLSSLSTPTWKRHRSAGGFRFSISQVGVIAFDNQISKRGEEWLETYSADIFEGSGFSQTHNYVHFIPNRRHFQIFLRSLNQVDRAKGRREYEHALKQAESVRRRMPDAAISTRE